MREKGGNIAAFAKNCTKLGTLRAKIRLEPAGGWHGGCKVP